MCRAPNRRATVRAAAPGRAPTIQLPGAARREAARASPGSVMGSSATSAAAVGAASIAAAAPPASARRRGAFTQCRLAPVRTPVLAPELANQRGRGAPALVAVLGLEAFEH